MRIGFVGTGRIGGHCARLFAADGHDLMLSFSRHAERLRALAADIGSRTGTVEEAIAFAEVVIVSIPWDAFPDLLAQVRSFRDRIVIDTSNAYGSVDLPQPGQTAASFNAERLPHARYTKTFNTLTAAFQAETAGRRGNERVVQWLCGDDTDAKYTAATLIDGIGYVPVDIGTNAQAQAMESPRRPGAVYGEAYRLPEAMQVVAAIRDGRPLPPTPRY